MSNPLLERIDLALQMAGKSRGDLATALDVNVQAISNLKRRPGSRMLAEHVAKAAVFMHVDIYWLCTGEGEPRHHYLIRESVRLLQAMPKADQERAFSHIYRMHQGEWPIYDVVENNRMHET